jgi:hypothetical protein
MTKPYTLTCFTLLYELRTFAVSRALHAALSLGLGRTCTFVMLNFLRCRDLVGVHPREQHAGRFVKALGSASAILKLLAACSGTRPTTLLTRHQ